jgi:hypothetical protein
MLPEHQEFIRKAKKEYRKIGYVECPAFDDEKIYFTSAGFNHLLRKGRKAREKAEQYERMLLMKFAPRIIKSSKKFIKSNHSIIKNKPDAHFWSLMSVVNGQKLTVIIRQLDKHPKHFFSIFS